jgi:hypothetical protein
MGCITSDYFFNNNFKNSEMKKIYYRLSLAYGIIFWLDLEFDFDKYTFSHMLVCILLLGYGIIQEIRELKDK